MSLQRRCMDHFLVAVSLEIDLQGQDVLFQISPSFFILGLHKNSPFIVNYHDFINIHALLLYSVFGH